MMKVRTTITVAAVAAILFAACGSDSATKPEFNESAVREAIEESGNFDGAAEVDSAVLTFRNICESPDTSINEYSVHGLLTDDSKPALFVANARAACPDKFDRVQRMIDNGDCFGGPLAGCS